MIAKQLVKLLEEAIESNDVKKVKSLLSKNPRLSNAGGRTKETLPVLWQAAVRGRHKIVELLVKSGANVQHLRMNYERNLTSPRITIMHWMGIAAYPCTDDHIRVGKILVRHGADVNAYNPVERLTIPPLSYAVLSGNTKWAEFLLQKGLKHQDLALRRAAAMLFYMCPVESRVDFLWLLLRHGLDPGYQDDLENNLLLMLVQRSIEPGALEIAKYLINAGVLIDEVDEYGMTALHNCVCNLNMELILFLLKMGADVNTVDVTHRTPLDYAVLMCNKYLVCLLLSYGADVDAKNNGGYSALHHAMYRNDEEILSLLLEKGPDVFALNESGETPFIARLEKISSGSQDELVDRMLREFAKLRFESVPIAAVDLERIKANASFQEYFDKSLIELDEKLCGTKFYGVHSYYSVLKMSRNRIKKLANLSKNDEFVAMFNANLDKLTFYKKDLRRILNLAKEVRDKLNAVESRLKCIFGSRLPAVVIRILRNNLTLEDLPVQ